MTRKLAPQEQRGVIEDWIDGRSALPTGSDGHDDPMLQVLVAARAAQSQLSDDDATAVYSAVRARLRRSARSRLVLNLGVAATVLFAAGAALRPHPPVRTERTIVKHMRFQAERGGRLVLLEITVSRIEKKGQRHASEPSS